MVARLSPALPLTRHILRRAFGCIRRGAHGAAKGSHPLAQRLNRVGLTADRAARVALTQRVFGLFHGAPRVIETPPRLFASLVSRAGEKPLLPPEFAAQIALALCEIGSIAERRIAMLVDPALSGLPAFLTPRPGLNSGFMIPQVTAAALVSENKQRAYPASVDSIPTSANQEDHVSMAAHGARRLAPMAENAMAVIAIEWLCAAQGCDFHAPLATSAPLAAVHALLRAQVPHLSDDRHIQPDMQAAIQMVRSGALVEAARNSTLPAIA